MKATIWTGILLLAVCLGLGAVYLGMLVLAVERQGYGWSEMDWDDNGTTTLGEYFLSSDIGKRSTVRDGITCMEYFHYKDGSGIRMACEQEGRR